MAYTANQTTLRNISGVTKFFDFTSEHGNTLAANEDINIPGNIWTMWMNDSIKQAALLYAINNNLIEVLRTPATVGFDTSLSGPRVLVFASGDVASAFPAYGSYSGSAPS